MGDTHLVKSWRQRDFEQVTTKDDCAPQDAPILTSSKERRQQMAADDDECRR